MVSVQRSFGRTMAAEVGYLRTDGDDFPLQRQFTQAFDRRTGARPNPALGAPGGYYVDSSQTMVYNGLQTSVRKRFSNSYSWDVNYTLGKSDATQGGDLSAYYIAALREQPGLLGSRIRSRAVQQRHPSSAERLVHLSSSPESRRTRRHQRRPRRLAGFRHRAGAIGVGAASPRSHRESTAAGPMSSPASTWCSPIGGTAAMPEAAPT